MARAAQAVGTQVIGRPAAYARKLRNAALLKAAGLGLGTLLGGGLAVVGLADQRWPVAAAGIAVAVACTAGCERARTAAARARAGIAAEDLVARHVTRQGFALVAFGPMLGAGGDCDVVVAGPCLAAVEVKYGRGAVSHKGGRLRDARRSFPGDPVAQARRQAGALGRLAGTPASPVVCVTGMTNPPLRVGDVTVCSAADLPGVLASLTSRSSGGAMLAAALERACSPEAAGLP
jgi:hypothetical protein